MYNTWMPILYLGFIQPKLHKKVSLLAFKFQAKELVFDVDLDAYDNIRTCCSGPMVCRLCWRFLAIAVKVIDRALHSKWHDPRSVSVTLDTLQPQHPLLCTVLPPDSLQWTLALQKSCGSLVADEVYTVGSMTLWPWSLTVRSGMLYCNIYRLWKYAKYMHSVHA